MTTTKIESLRKARGWTQERLAMESGLNVRTIQRLEAGNETSLETLRLIADAFNVSISDLFEKLDDHTKAEAIDNLDDERLTQMRHRTTLTSLYKRVTLVAFIILMIISGTLISHYLTANTAQHDGTPSLFGISIGVFWLVSWLIIFPSLKLIRTIFIEPKLDKKYPLTRGLDMKRHHF